MAEKTDDTNGARQRIALKAAKEVAAKAARKAVEEMMRSEAFRATLREIIGLSGDSGSSAKQTTTETRTRETTEVGAESTVDLASVEREIREQLLEHGVRRADLDWAVMRFASVVASLDDQALAKYDVSDFVEDLAKSAPQVFREGALPKASDVAVEAEKGSEGEAKSPPATTGTKSEPGPKPVREPAFDATKASREEVARRLAEIKAMAGRSAIQ